jgi:phage terminase small subunit
VNLRQKHPDTLAFKRGGRYRPLKVVEVSDRLAPYAPRGLHPKAQQAWRDLWGSTLGASFHITDVPGIERWVKYLSTWFQVTNVRDQMKLEKAMRELEKSYGLDPMSRLRLGLTLVDEKKAVASLKKPKAPTELTG